MVRRQTAEASLDKTTPAVAQQTLPSPGPGPAFARAKVHALIDLHSAWASSQAFVRRLAESRTSGPHGSRLHRGVSRGLSGPGTLAIRVCLDVAGIQPFLGRPSRSVLPEDKSFARKSCLLNRLALLVRRRLQLLGRLALRLQVLPQPSLARRRCYNSAPRKVATRPTHT